jgi:hypothetical protein
MWLDGKIKFRDFANDVVAGLTSFELTRKYALSPEELQTLLREILEAEAAGLVDFNLRSIWGERGVTIEHFRVSHRHMLSFTLPIFEENNPENEGIVIDISRYGFRAKGLEARSGDIRNLVIPGDGFYLTSELTLKAGCRWIGRDEIAETWVSGFFVITVSGGSWEDFNQLFEVVDTGPRTISHFL